MNTTKAVISFTRTPAAELGPIAHIIHDKMTTNVATFDAPHITMAVFQTLIDTYDQAYQAKANKGKAEVLAFNLARTALEKALNTLGLYVNMVANGDPAIVVLSGFPSYVTGHTTDPTAPAAPTDVRLKRGQVSGSVRVECKPDRSPSTNQVQTSTADPMVEANWHDRGNFTGQKGEFGGFTPGDCVWFRIRTMGLKGIWGDWSDPAEIMIV